MKNSTVDRDEMHGSDRTPGGLGYRFGEDGLGGGEIGEPVETLSYP
jgi:hypothetical protein